jgi:cytochrome c2
MRTRIFLSAVLIFVLRGSAGIFGEVQAQTHGVIAGWDSLDGRVLLGELNCVACHAGGTIGEGLLTKSAPNLDDVGARVTPQYLRTYLANPHDTKPGTTMPDMLQAVPEGQRAAAVEALVHFLAGRGGPINQRSSGASLGELDHGRDLFHAVGCVACHQPNEPPAKHKIDAAAKIEDEADPAEGAKEPLKSLRPSVPLPPLAKKTTVASLAEFLHNPLAVRPAGRMPSLGLSTGDARAIAAYLLREQYSKTEKAPGAGVDVAYYNVSVGKAVELAKHKPVFETKLPELNLAAAIAKVPVIEGRKAGQGAFGVRFHGLLDVPADGKYRFWTMSDDGSVVIIGGKMVVDNDGMHSPGEKGGEVDLRRGRHPFEVLFVQGGGGYELSVFWQPPGATERSPIADGVLLNEAAAMIPQGIEDFQVDAVKAERGREWFTKLGCASCHKTSDKLDSLVSGPVLAKVNTASADGCLAEKVKAGAPKYDLSKEQRAAIAKALTALQEDAAKLAAPAELHLTMTAFNCYACHQRDKVGGPEDARRDYFVYETIVDLGDEGRLPPPLHEVGAKLTNDGFADMLIAGHKYRTYMATRMPQFGEKNIGHLPALFQQCDAGKIARHEPQFSPRHIDDGRFLMGNKALSCINCHAWGPLRLPGAEGMDLIQAPRRLQPGWFQAWLKDPQKMRPGTRMPSAWPQAKSFFADVQKGSVDGQIDAIWAYLSMGDKGGLPPGLTPGDENLLTPADEPIVFRTFLSGVSAHAILVGFRQRTHMAFDANRVRSVVAWTGDFITTKSTWDGRAGEYAQIPAQDTIKFPEGPAFAVLDSETTPWPADLPKKPLGSNRTPAGWKFRGYRLDEQRMPTFLYDIGKLHVEESPATEYSQGEAVLTRRFSLKSPDAMPRLSFRAATGKEIVAKDGAYVVDGKLRFKISATPEVKPVVRVTDAGQELLVPLEIAGGKQQQLEVRMAW